MNLNHTTKMLENDILALILAEQGKRKQVFFKLKKEMFNDPINSMIFAECQKLNSEDEEIDPTIIMSNLQDITIAERLCELNFTDKLSVKLFNYCSQLQKIYFNKLILEAKTTKEAEKIIELKNELSFEDESIEDISNIEMSIKDRIKNKKDSLLLTFYSKLDEIVGSFQGGEMITLGGNPGMGKTAFALNLARNICMQDKKVLFVSLEMTKQQLQDRLICIDTGLNAHKAKNLTFNEEEQEIFAQGEKDLKQWQIRLLSKITQKGQNQSFTIERLRENVLKEKREKGLDFVILDYLGLIDYKGNISEYEKLSMFSRKIKRLAIECDVPILNLVQLNRDNVKRTPKEKIESQKDLEEAILKARPTMADIRGSGAIEQDSDYVLFVFRPYVISKTIPQTKLEILIDKNRHGEGKKKVDLYFNTETQLIKDPQIMTKPA